MRAHATLSLVALLALHAAASRVRACVEARTWMHVLTIPNRTADTRVFSSLLRPLAPGSLIAPNKNRRWFASWTRRESNSCWGRMPMLRCISSSGMLRAVHSARRRKGALLRLSLSWPECVVHSQHATYSLRARPRCSTPFRATFRRDTTHSHPHLHPHPYSQTTPPSIFTGTGTATATAFCLHPRPHP
jgi:hypothetical protein